MRELSLNVLAATGFKSSHGSASEFGGYREALGVILNNALLMMLVPPRVMEWPFVPKPWRRVGKAMRDYRKHMLHALQMEKDSILQGKPEAGGLIGSLIRASEDSPHRAKVEQLPPRSARTKPLSNSEVLGNWFVMNVAGHDTTANTLVYGILFLAANPSVQDWIWQELREVLPEDDSSLWNYEQCFPRLKRCQAIMVGLRLDLSMLA